MAILVCAKCKQSKSSSEFSNGEQRKQGHRWCRPCRSSYAKEWRSRNPEKVRKYNQKPEAVERRRAYDRSRSSKQNADAWFRYRYGLTVAEVDAMIEEQGGVCAICCQPETKTDPRTGRVRRLCVDHDHRTGLPRRMLCQRCNWTLSRVDDDVELLQRFIAYLDQHAKATFAPR